MTFEAALTRRVATVLGLAVRFVAATVFAPARFVFDVGADRAPEAGLPEVAFFAASGALAAAGLRRMDEEVDVVMMDSCEECIDSIRLTPDFDLIRIK